MDDVNKEAIDKLIHDILTPTRVMSALEAWAKDNCECGNMEANGTFWEEGAPPDWVACHACRTVRFMDVRPTIAFIHVLSQQGYL